MSSSYLCLGFPRGPFPPGIPIKILHAFIISHIRAVCHTHHILFDLIILKVIMIYSITSTKCVILTLSDK
jgi:hypothetical protein